MHWIVLSAKDTANNTLEKRLWNTADRLRSNLGAAVCRHTGLTRDKFAG